MGKTGQSGNIGPSWDIVDEQPRDAVSRVTRCSGLNEILAACIVMALYLAVRERSILSCGFDPVRFLIVSPRADEPCLVSIELISRSALRSLNMDRTSHSANIPRWFGIAAYNRVRGNTPAMRRVVMCQKLSMPRIRLSEIKAE